MEHWQNISEIQRKTIIKMFTYTQLSIIKSPKWKEGLMLKRMRVISTD